MNKVFGFDVGLGSLGLAVREGDKIKHAASLLMDSEFGSVGDQADRRRFHRTKQAHKARENNWERIWEEIGKTPLKGRRHERVDNKNFKVTPGDEKLEREFPSQGDETVYTSCLLRIKLLEGEKLEDWQIYKAIYSALQRRGYDNNVPWKQQAEEPKKSSGKEQSPDELMQKFTSEIDGLPEKYHYSCYYEAQKMGLWDVKKGIKNIRIDKLAGRARGNVVPREIVENELKQLLANAAKQIPSLKKIQIDKILYGEAATPYKYTKEHQGILAQKHPRFDNRCVGHCCLIPRYRVVRSDNIINLQVNFLLSLARMVYHINEETSDGNLAKIKLSIDDIRYWHTQAESKIKKLIGNTSKDELSKEASKCFKIGKRDWKKWLQGKDSDAYPVVNYDQIVPPKTDGRSRYSKPALILMKELILSGKNPVDFHKEIFQAIDKARLKDKNDKEFGVRVNNYKFRLRKKDINFLSKIKFETGGIYTPSLSIAEKYFEQDDDLNKKRDATIWQLIGSTQNYVVRHRLAFFYGELQKLNAEYGKPDKVVFEFARDEFMGQKRKKDYINYMKGREKLYKDARGKVDEFGLSGGKTVKKMTLLNEQKSQCPFASFIGYEDKSCLSSSDVDKYEIEHIIPQGNKFNGPDAIWNIVLTSSEVNKEKGERPPYLAIPASKWQAYTKHIESLNELDGKKKKLLLATSPEEVEELMERYYGLAVTSMVARMARDLTCLYFDWQPGESGISQKVIVVTGGLVAKIRRKYGLDKILGDWETIRDKPGKDRTDRRHHALDAMVISYLPQWATNKDKSKFFTFPSKINADYFSSELEKVYPEYKRWVKAALAEQPLGLINSKGGDSNIHVTRRELQDYLTCEASDIKDKDGKLRARISKILDSNIREQLLENLDIITGGIDLSDSDELNKIKDEWNEHILTTKYRQSKHKGGSLVRRIRVSVSKENATNYKNISKDRGEPGYRGQYYYSAKTSSTGTMQHGFYVVEKNNKFDIMPVYSFLSPSDYMKQLQQEEYQVYENMLFKRRGVWIKIKQEIGNSKELIAPGIYIISSFTNDRIILEDQRGKKYTSISVTKLFSDNKCEVVKSSI